MSLLFQFWYAIITVGDADVLNQEGFLRDTIHFSALILNFKSIRQKRHEKTLTHIREIKKVVEEITHLC